MTGLTLEQRRLVEQAGDPPVRTDDPEVHQSYVLIRADVIDYPSCWDGCDPKMRLCNSTLRLFLC